MFTAHVYRLYPSREQRIQLAQHFGCARVVYNDALNYSQAFYQNIGKTISQVDLINRLPGLRQERPYLKDVNAQVLQQSVIDFCQARTNFFRTKKGYPQYKNKHSRQSVRFPQACRVDEINHTVFVQKIGTIPAVIHQPVGGIIKSVTISKNSVHRYHAAVLIEDGLTLPTSNADGKTIGLDLGLKDLLVTSDGERITNPKHFNKHKKNLKRKQQHLSRCKKESNRRKKAVLLVAKIHLKITNQRKDFHHKLSRRLVDDNQVIVIEDLAIQNMVKNRKLSRAISDVSWGQLIGFTRYKTIRDGKMLLKCDRWLPSSKLCSVCSTLNVHLKLAERTWTCLSCHTIHDRDLNAANNIVKGGLLDIYPINYLMDQHILKRA
jgi:putative transposase